MNDNIFPIDISIKEDKNISRESCPTRIGIPFPSSELFSTSELELIDNNGLSIPFQVKVTARWFDKSIRWILIDFHTSINSLELISYALIKSKNKASVVSNLSIQITERNKNILINTGTAEFVIDKKYFRPFNEISIDGTPLDIKNSSINLLKNKNNSFQPIIDEIIYPENNESHRSTLFFKGYFISDDNIKFLQFQSSLTFFANSALCELEFTLHNPMAAKHLGGFWDMGDEASEYFNSLSVDINLTETPLVQWKNLTEESWSNINSPSIRLYQDSSGGKNWNHHIHVDKSSASTVSFKGYQLIIDNEILRKGERASPIFSFKTKNNTELKTHISQFWQNFPNAISLDSNKIHLEIFPPTKKSPYELQGGEQKSQTIIFDFELNSQKLEQYVTPLNTTLSLQHYSNSKAIPSLPQQYNEAKIDKIINQGIQGDNNFFIKREQADEFGWRNFGECWADHETLEHDNDESLVTHYNNQYDPIYGFAKQYLLTGNPQWFELMHDLATHVKDIDIYHTTNDRLEYNNGLFWHTDHYLDGKLCTHRTFSKSHMEISHVEQSGGGPGAEHCYTTGLMLHYFMTGSISSRETALSLTHWSKFTNEGSNTVTSRLLEFAKKDINKIKRLIKGDFLFNYKYPLSRGTGNYINTLINAFILTRERTYLDTVASIIRNTISAIDNIEQRALMTNIEENWHYTVLIQSVALFLNTKENEHQLDDDYQYALQAFIHYADWLFNNEKPYLESSELLHYPNDTWVGQDIRKYVLLTTYTKYCDFDIKNKVHEESKRYENYISDYFNGHTNDTTRILALLMQSYTYSHSSGSSQQNTFSTDKTLMLKDSQLKLRHVFLQLLIDLSSNLMHLNIKKEIQFIKSRIS